LTTKLLKSAHRTAACAEGASAGKTRCVVAVPGGSIAAIRSCDWWRSQHLDRPAATGNARRPEPIGSSRRDAPARGGDIDAERLQLFALMTGRPQRQAPDSRSSVAFNSRPKRAAPRRRPAVNSAAARPAIVMSSRR
jgi:hypothetical protein